MKTNPDGFVVFKPPLPQGKPPEGEEGRWNPGGSLRKKIPVIIPSAKGDDGKE
jgi:hypothetical protein